MGLLNPYVGLKRDTGGYYPDYPDYATDASGSFYNQNDNAAHLAAAANNEGRVNLSSFSPYDSQSETAQGTTDNMFSSDQTQQAQLSSEISYAQDATRRASQDTQADGTTPGGPDVQLNTGGSDAQDEEGGDSRRRRQSFGQSGAGLKI